MGWPTLSPGFGEGWDSYVALANYLTRTFTIGVHYPRSSFTAHSGLLMYSSDLSFAFCLLGSRMLLLLWARPARSTSDNA